MARSALPGIILATVLGGTAVAADFPVEREVPIFVSAQYDWSGFYAGLQAGYSVESDATREFLTAGRVYTGFTFRYHPDTAVGGGQVGFNFQLRNVVFGVEGDVEALHARGGFNDAGNGTAANPGGVGRVRRDWQASVRGRLGYAFDRVMVYATGGVAFTEFNYFFYNPFARFGEGSTTQRTGWTVGGGASYALTDNILLGLEYRRTEYDRFDYVARSAFLGLTGQQSPHMDTVRAMVSYKF